MAEQTKLDWNYLLQEALTAPGNLYGVYDRFHDYSLTNMLLFRAQGVREPVASYKRWQSLGRHVLRGARAKEVIVPLLITEHQAAPPDPTQEATTNLVRLIGFKVVRGVFALSDTDGPALPPFEHPQWDLPTALDKLKIRRVPFDSLNGNVQGYSVGRDIAINPVAVHPEKTLFHELGHVVLGHTLASSLSEYAQHRGVKEFQAESTAYLCLNELDRMTPPMAEHSRGYIQHWLEDARPTEREIRLVFAGAEQILRAGRLAVSGAGQMEAGA